ncbi:MAG: hypothetical protein JNM46_01485 [Anaerolineales bacterium]|nr:hypothetical protein [Anaerolineales bacterium]
MNTKKFSILLAALMLVLVQLACAAGEPALSGTRTSTDQDGTQTTSTFGAFDTVYVVSDLANGAAGNVITSKWYAVNAEGLDPNFFLDEADITVTEADAPFNGTIYFFFPAPSGGWPTGTYKVEIYFNGALSGTAEFSVQ